MTKNKVILDVEELSTEGKKYGVNIRTIKVEHVSKIGNNPIKHGGNIPVVVWCSEIGKYLVVDGQHLIESKIKQKWECEIIEGDISKDNGLIEYCYSESIKHGNTSAMIAFGTFLNILNKYYGIYVKEHNLEYGDVSYGKNSELYEYIELKTHFKYDYIRTSIPIMISLNKLNKLGVADREWWSKSRCIKESEIGNDKKNVNEMNGVYRFIPNNKVEIIDKILNGR